MSIDVRVVFTASGSWFGRAIRKLTGSRVSHVFLEFDVWGKRMVMESTIGGTRLVPASRSRHNIVWEYEFQEEGKQEIISMMDFLGSEYDYAGVLMLAWVKMAWRWLGLKMSYPGWSSKSLKCSELLFRFLEKVAPDDVRLKEWNPELVTPQHIVEFCLDNDDLFEEVT